MERRDLQASGRSLIVSDYLMKQLRAPRGPPAAEPAVQKPAKRQAVKRHHHKHNLKHRYDFLETLGKGTYGTVKKAVERSGKVVRSVTLCGSSWLDVVNAAVGPSKGAHAGDSCV